MRNKQQLRKAREFEPDRSGALVGFLIEPTPTLRENVLQAVPNGHARRWRAAAHASYEESGRRWIREQGMNLSPRSVVLTTKHRSQALEYGKISGGELMCGVRLIGPTLSAFGAATGRQLTCWLPCVTTRWCPVSSLRSVGAMTMDEISAPMLEILVPKSKSKTLCS